jgi:subtilase family serine protease
MLRFWARAFRQGARHGSKACSKRRQPTYRPQIEVFEEKIQPSSTVMSPTYMVIQPTHATNQVTPASGSAGPVGLTPSQVRQAYGINAITFSSNGTTIAGTGTGQTIAIVDAYDDPSIATDLSVFDQQFGLAAPPSFVKVGLNASGTASTTSFPTQNSGWAGEEELDVEWAHASAPDASIVLVEANSASNNDLLAGVNYARNYAGVTAVSMSWGGSDFSGQTQDDSYFTTPAGHVGITFFASAGDSGTPSGWPATSSHVVAVGGTTLNVDAAGDYLSESAWSDSGGGLSSVVTQPSYQSGLVIHNGSQVISANGMRAVPDVAYLADPNTGVAVYGSYGFGGWAQVGGTSAGAPEWAALMAIVDQGRVDNGLTPLDGATQTLPMLYQLPSSNFHDITTGSNGYAAGPGFDLVTGRGSPVANLLVPALAGSSSGGTTSQPPTVATAAHVVSSTATTVTLGALGADQAGASSLTYTWAVTGTAPAAVTFSPKAPTPPPRPLPHSPPRAPTPSRSRFPTRPA